MNDDSELPPSEILRPAGWDRRYSRCALVATLLVVAVLTAGVSYFALVPEDEPKTTADKLIGTWMLIKLDGKPMPPSSETYLKFAKNQRITLLSIREGKLSTERHGEYTVVGNDIHVVFEPSADDDHSQYILFVQLLEGDTFIITFSNSDGLVNEFRRVTSNRLRKLRW